MLNVIQLGLTFSDEHGNLPTCNNNGVGCVWQFNFREFNVDRDVFASDSIQLLHDSGINSRRTEKVALMRSTLLSSSCPLHLMKFCNNLHGGLSKLAELLDVQRVGIGHQADQIVFLLHAPSEAQGVLFPWIHGEICWCVVWPCVENGPDTGTY
ncbi:hypothetical protein KSP40_PGU015001 [Platanthera guangdongensis]|uniref:Uncharacterized protein n=1 Tax=Platanthera guangdongensis TaxID=2320717 RepID=A0ABR2LW65_9ASPA